MADVDQKAHRCTARSKSTGAQCRQPAIPGGTVCRFHGGAAPQVQQKARERLAALVDPAIGTLGKQLKNNKFPHVALSAAKDILDRNDITGKTKIEHSGTVQSVPAMLANLTDEELETFRRLAAKAQGQG